MARFNAKVGGRVRGADARRQMAGVINAYSRLVRHIEEATPEILMEALEPTFEKSQEYCPRDTGELLNSGYLEIRELRGKPTVEMGYGFGGSPSYAVAVHENLEWRHKAPTRAKWLQTAIEEDEQAIQGRIVRAYSGMF